MFDVIEEILETNTQEKIIERKQKRKIAQIKYKQNNPDKVKEWYEKNKQKTIARSKIWAKNNKDKLRNIRRATKLRLKYGITREEYLMLLSKQDNKCKICGKAEKDNGRELAVDHCHNTNRIRGILCVRCNAGLGNFKDNIRLLEKAVNYLRETL